MKCLQVFANFYYDASGTLLKRNLSDGNEWVYIEELLLKNKKIYQLNHDEGRAVYDTINKEWNFEFDYRDHQGNLRLSFRDSLAAPINGVYAPPVVTQIDERDPTGVALSGLNYSNQNKNNFGFIGRETISEAGWIDLNNRFYMPELMRFGQTDPIIKGQEHLSLYQYGWNNPVRFSDPNGNFCIPCVIVLAGLFFASQPAMSPSGGANAKQEQAAYKQAYNDMGSDVIGTLIPGAKSKGATQALYAAAKKEVKEEVTEQTKKIVDKAINSQEGVKIDNSRDKHIFRESDGHFSQDTPAARQKLETVGSNPKNSLGTDKYGNEWNAQTQKDGTQVWTQTRDGKIINGGVNQTPRTFNKDTGLSSPINPK